MDQSLKLSEAVLDEFVQFQGDMLAYVRSGRGTLQYDWDRIDELLQHIFLIRAGLASEVFRENTERELLTMAPDENLRLRLWAMGADRVIAAHRQIVI